MASVRKKGPLRALAILGVSAALMTSLITPASAASIVSATGLTASVSGTTVTVSTTIKASPAATGAYAGVCIRSAGNANRDLLNTNVWLTTSGTKITKTGTFAAGTYSYWSCAKVDGAWTSTIDTKKSFTVGGGSTTPPPTGGGSSPSGQSMPVGDLAGWKQVVSDDFTGALSTTKWGYPYLGEIPSAPGAYWAASQVKVRDGKLVLETAKIGGRWTSGGIMAKQKLTYGKILIRTRMDKAAGVKYAHLLWPQSPNTWYTGGEIDIAEDGGGDRTKTTGTVIWFVNKVASGKTQYQKQASADFSQWHTVGVEWSPGKVVYTLDGAAYGTVENANVPSGPMSMALQTEALLTCSQWNSCVNSSTPALTNAEFDWVSIYTRA